MRSAAGEARPTLIGLERAEIEAAVLALGESAGRAPMRARQIWQWLYRRGAVAFDEMTTLPKDLRVRLAAAHTVDRPEIVVEQRSSDGTRKWLLRFPDGQEVETVFIPEEDRGALCVSTQVGCTLTCAFCHTGTMPLVRNLKPAEILSQVLVASDSLREWTRGGAPKQLTNIVVMGMGEPLFNYDSTAKAMRIAMDREGIDLSRRRITLSTSGVVPRIEQCGRELGVGLAVSLHAVRDDLRDRLVPINRKWKIAELMEACRTYPVRGKLVTFEYVMLDGVNDTDADARELVRLLHGIPAKVNLIPFNPWPGSGFACSPWPRIERFARRLMDAGHASPVRTPRGRDIQAACGQLKTESRRAEGRRPAPVEAAA